MFTSPAYRSPDELSFGIAKKPLSYGLELSVGKGKVIPEIKYWPRRDVEAHVEKLPEEYEHITRDLLERAVDLGVKALQLETELNYQVTRRPELIEEIISKQRELMEQFHSRYGISLALRVTVADIRRLRGLEYEEAMSTIFEAFETACRSGADVISIESIGGKEVFDYSIIRADITGIVFSLAVLGVRDMHLLWQEIVKIARRHGVVPGGDTACGFANTAMRLAGGFASRMLPHVLAALVRALGASRSLVAYEEGATGPGKDCGYENVILKYITGYPMSMEGKTSATAHSSLLGNIVAYSCDLWSNEQVENIRLFGGTGPQVLLEMLFYDTELMNTAIRCGRAHELRELFVKSDKYRDPQAFVLSPEVAWKIANALTKEAEHPYRRTVMAGLIAMKEIERAHREGHLTLDRAESKYLKSILRRLSSLPEDEDELIDRALDLYRKKVKELKPEHYNL